MEKKLPNRLNNPEEEEPDHVTLVEDLKDALNEIKMAETGQLKLQNARDLIGEL